MSDSEKPSEVPINLNACRFCSSENEENLIIDKKFKKKINILTGLEFNNDEKLPTTSCLKCYDSINQAVDVKQSVIESEDKLRRLLDSILVDIKVEFEEAPFCYEDVNLMKPEIQIKQESLHFLQEESAEEEDSEDNKREIRKKPRSEKEKAKCSICGIVVCKGTLRTHIRRVHERIRKHNCTECDKSFFKLFELEVHLKTHEKDRKLEYSCGECDKSFLTKPGLIVHRRVVHLKKIQKCEYCERTFTQTSSLNIHLKTKHNIGDTKYKPRTRDCDQCGKKLSTEKALQKHIVVYHMDPSKKDELLNEIDKERVYNRQKIPCPDCGEVIMRASMRRHKVRVHEQFKACECDLCGASYFTKGELEHHMKRKHVKHREMDYSCKICGKKYFSHLGVLKHVSRIHQNKSIEKSHICEICGKAFEYNLNYLEHIRAQHTKERPYPCDECNKFFVSKPTLNKHKRNCHSNVNSVCEFCSKVFKNRRNLRAHIYLNHEERKFPCTFAGCDKRFTTKSLLQKHTEVHLEIRKFGCPHCENRYFVNQDLKRHIQIHHMKVLMTCEVPGCQSTFARKPSYKKHVLSNHSNLGEENVQNLLQRINNIKLPDPELPNSNN